MFPANAPTTISIRATDMATLIEIREASSAIPIHSAEISQSFMGSVSKKK
jgi:hypothetical protein